MRWPYFTHGPGECRDYKNSKKEVFWVEFQGGCRDHPSNGHSHKIYSCRHGIVMTPVDIIKEVAIQIESARSDCVGASILNENGCCLLHMLSQSKGECGVQYPCHCLINIELPSCVRELVT